MTDLAVGGWTCRCGLTKVYNVVSQSHRLSLVPQCPHCGDEAEILPLPVRSE